MKIEWRYCSHLARLSCLHMMYLQPSSVASSTLSTPSLLFNVRMLNSSEKFSLTKSQTLFWLLLFVNQALSDMRIVKNGSGKNLRDWDPLSRELDCLSLWNEKRNPTKDSRHQPAPTCLHPFVLLRFVFLSSVVISSDASVSPTTSLRVGRGPIWAHSLTQMTQSGIPVSSSSSSSSFLSFSSSSPLIRVHPPLLNYAVEFKQNIPGTGETWRAGIWKVHPWKLYLFLNIVNFKTHFPSFG